jgi:hypothetical protein
MLYNAMPDDLRNEIYAWLRLNAADERKPSDTEEQFLYKSRKKAIGPFKAKLWSLPDDKRAEIGAVWEKQFKFLFEQLSIRDTRKLMEKHVEPVVVHKSLADFGVVEKEAEDVTGLAD